jgi:hypothetical protein
MLVRLVAMLAPSPAMLARLVAMLAPLVSLLVRIVLMLAITRTLLARVVSLLAMTRQPFALTRRPLGMTPAALRTPRSRVASVPSRRAHEGRPACPPLAHGVAPTMDSERFARDPIAPTSTTLPITRWATSSRSALASIAAVLLGLAGVVLSLWPATGLPLLCVSIGLLALGFWMARRVLREREARGARWGAIAALTLNGLAGIVVSASVLLGAAVSAVVLRGPPSTPPPTQRYLWDYVHEDAVATIERHGPSLALGALLVGAAIAADALNNDAAQPQRDAGPAGHGLTETR